VQPVIVDPSIIPKADWEITVDVVDGVTSWNLSRDGVEVISSYANVEHDRDYPVVDGILWRVLEAEPAFRRIADGGLMVDEIKGPGGAAVSPDDNGGPGRNVFHRENSTGDWRISTGGGGTPERFTRAEADLFGHDIVIRFDGAPDNYGWWAFDFGELGPVPFSVWTRDPNTGEESRMIPILFSGRTEDAFGTPGTFDYSDSTRDNICEDCPGYAHTDLIYGYTGDYAAFAADYEDDGELEADPTAVELFARLVFASEAKVMPALGTELIFTVNHYLMGEDRFTVSTEGVTFGMGKLKDDLSDIRVVPNPYRNQSVYELNAFSRRVKFTNLPESCTIRIFNLAGDLLRTIEKEPGPASIAEWDLLTEYDLPVASGVYIYHVEAKDGGKVMGSTSGKMAIFMEKERLNTF
jgi:hypothetical protein